MWKSIPRRTASLIGILVLLYSYGCILSPEEDPAPYEREPVEFMDQTEREHVITNLVLSYREKYYPAYEKLILTAEDTYNGSPYPFAPYYWYNQPGAVGEEDYILDLDDLARTQNLFLAAQGMPAKQDHPVIYRLTIELTEGSWSPVNELGGEPCEDCWLTERQYDIFLEMGETDIHAADNVQFYIVPVDFEGTKIYKIAVAQDIADNEE